MSLSRVRLHSGSITAELVPDANLVCASLRDGGAELLHAGRGVEAYAERGKTMGIPLLYPWANRLSRPGYAAAGAEVTLPAPEGRYPTDPNGLPIHGALPGDLRWEVGESDGDRLTARLDWDEERLLELFPFRHHVEVVATLTSGALRLTTTVHASAGDRVPVSFGYHPYLTLPGSSRRSWRVALGATEHLELDARSIPTGSREPLANGQRELELGERSLDDGYAGLPVPAVFRVGDGTRTLTAMFEDGYAWGQVYAPPGEDFICFEPMTAPTDALNSGTGLTVLAPGERYTASVAFALAA